MIKTCLKLIDRPTTQMQAEHVHVVQCVLISILSIERQKHVYAYNEDVDAVYRTQV